MPPPDAAELSHWRTAIVLVLLSLAAYSNSFRAGFALDSGVLVLNDPRVQEITRHNAVAILQQDYWYSHVSAGLYRPIVTFSWLFNYVVLGDRDQPFGYHAVNFAFHALNTLLLWSLALAIFRRPLPAAFTAAIFAVHPIATEAVTNISGRPDLLAATAVLGGLLLYARAPDTTGLNRILVNIGLFLAALLGLFCKENAIVLMPLMLLYDLSFRPERLRKWTTLLSSYAAVAYAAAIALYARHWVMSRLRAPEFPFVDNPIVAAGFLQGRLTALTVIVRYVKLLVWPQTLSCDYSYHQIGLSSIAGGLGALAVVLTMLAGVVLCYRRSRPAFFFGMFFFGALFPVSNLPLVIGSIMAERFLYLPLAGFAGILVAAVWAAADRFAPRFALSPRTALALLGLMVVALAARTWFRNLDWQSNAQIWSAAVQASPDSYKTHHVVALELQRSENPAQILPAIAEAEKSVAIIAELPPEQSNTFPYGTLGLLWQVRGDQIAHDRPTPELPREAELAYLQAVAAYEQAIPIDHAINEERRRIDVARGWPAENIPNVGNAPLYSGLGDTLHHLGRLQDAVNAKIQFLQLAPAEVHVHAEIADLLHTLGRQDEAVQWAAQALLLGRSATELLKFNEYFRQLYPAGCPVMTGERSEGLHLECPTVKQVVCRGERHLLQLFRDTHFPYVEMQYRNGSLTQGTCPAAAP